MSDQLTHASMVKAADWRFLPRVDGPGGEKYVPLSNFLDIIEKRIILLTDSIARPGTRMRDTECLRGQVLELRQLQKALREQAPGPTDPNH